MVQYMMTEPRLDEADDSVKPFHKLAGSAGHGAYLQIASERNDRTSPVGLCIRS